MRNILVEQARRKGAHRHGGDARRVELTEGLAFIEPPADDLHAMDEAVQKLQAEKPHLAEIAMLRYFAGLSGDETAAVLGISASTLAREWRFARAWLARRLGDATGGGRRTDE
jgi:RNA polymerase sigma factor (TIGR02999 family)